MPIPKCRQFRFWQKENRYQYTLHTKTETEILKVVADLTVVNNIVQFRKLNLSYSSIPEINKNFLQSKLMKNQINFYFQFYSALINTKMSGETIVFLVCLK
jgi:hypothetical protein